VHSGELKSIEWFRADFHGSASHMTAMVD